MKPGYQTSNSEAVKPLILPILGIGLAVGLIFKSIDSYQRAHNSSDSDAASSSTNSFIEDQYGWIYGDSTNLPERTEAEIQREWYTSPQRESTNSIKESLVKHLK